MRVEPLPAVRIIEIAEAFDHGHVERFRWRLWPDGVIEENVRSSAEQWRGWELVLEMPAP